MEKATWIFLLKAIENKIECFFVLVFCKRTMNFNATYIESCENTTQNKNAGIILKGNTRNTNQPVHMILLCDTSGSMEQEKKLVSVKKSVNLLLSLLSPDDRISLVTFSDSSKIILSQAVPSADNREALQYRVDSLRPDGSTNMSAGLLDARNLVEPATTGRKQGIILLTDGYANVGVMQEDGLTNIVKQILSEFPGTSLTTVAYGVDHNAELLTNLGKTGGGAYNVVKNLEDVATVFGDILGGLVSVSVQGVQIQLPPGAEANTLYTCEKDPSGITTIYVGDIYADSEIIVMFRNNPSNGPIRVKGTDMRTLARIDEVVEPAPFVAGEVPPAIRITELRQRTANLIKQAATSHSSTILKEIDSLLLEISNDPTIRDHPLKAMLTEDLQHAKIIQTSRHVGAAETVEMLQHSAFLGTTRGLPSLTRPAPLTPPHAGALPPGPTNFLSPFSSRAQAHYAGVMRTMSQEPSQQSDDSQDTLS